MAACPWRKFVTLLAKFSRFYTLRLNIWKPVEVEAVSSLDLCRVQL
jgi:hypothetical protein